MSNTARGCQAVPFPQSPPPLQLRIHPHRKAPRLLRAPQKHPLGHTAATRGRGGSAAAFRCHRTAGHSPAPPLHPGTLRGRAPRSPRREAAAGREHPAPALPWLLSLLPLPDSPALFRPVQKSKPLRLCVPQALTHPPCRLRLSVCPGGTGKARPRDGASSQGQGTGGIGPTLALGSSLKQGLWKCSQPQNHPFRGLLATPAAGGLLGLSPPPPALQGEASPAWQELRDPNPLVQAGLH